MVRTRPPTRLIVMNFGDGSEKPGHSYQLKQFAKHVLAHLGFELRRRPSLPPTFESPLLASYEGLRGKRVAVDADLNHCIVPFGFSFGKEGWHPYVSALIEHQNGTAQNYESSYICRFNDHFKPANAAELLTGNADQPEGLRRRPPHAFTMPWDPDTVETRERKLVRGMAYENLLAGYPDEGIEGGVGAIGPISPTKGRIEFERLTNLFDSIREKGYLRKKGTDGDVKGIVLRRDEETRIVILSGHHRAAVCTALGYSTIPVRLSSSIIVRHDDAHAWPRVLDGTWNEQQAIDYFHQLFDCIGEDRARLYGIKDRGPTTTNDGN